MNYELAKELRDAGFPQQPAPDFWSHYWLETPDGSRHIDALAWVPGDKYIKIPSLSELIDECRKKTAAIKLWFRRDGSAGIQPEGRGPDEIVWYSSGDEAVARWWLVLNEK